MKRIIFTLAAAMLFSLSTFAQEADVKKDFYSHNVHAGCSVLNTYLPLNKDDINNISEVLNIGYEYRPLKRLGVGVDLGWMNDFGKHRKQINYAGGVSLPSITPYRSDYLLISACIRGIWVDTNYFSCYSGIRAGLALKLENKTCTNEPNFQLIPVGLEAGARRIRAYAELNLGAPNNVFIGVRFHF